MDIGFAELLSGDFEAAERLFADLLAFEEQGGDRERIANRSGDVERSLRLGSEINHAVLIGECEISLATTARIRGDEETYRRMMASGHQRFAELGISRKGRAEQFVVFPD